MIVLASASPRRLELLRSAGIEPAVDPANVDETHDPSVPPPLHAGALATAKARAVAARRPGETVLGADTIVVVGDLLFGKPRDADEAREMLRALSDRGHEVVTAVHLEPPEGASWAPTRLIVHTAVIFRALAEAEIEAYLASGEWEGKAGAYAIQGRAAAFVRAVAGSYTNVVGLPLAEVVEELRRVGELG